MRLICPRTPLPPVRVGRRYLEGGATERTNSHPGGAVFDFERRTLCADGHALCTVRMTPFKPSLMIWSGTSAGAGTSPNNESERNLTVMRQSVKSYSST